MTNINTFRAGLLRSSAPQPVLSAQGFRPDGQAVRHIGKPPELAAGYNAPTVEQPKDIYAEAATRAQRKAGLRSLSDALVAEGQKTEVLGHVHPRTRRAALDAELTMEGR